MNINQAPNVAIAFTAPEVMQSFAIGKYDLNNQSPFSDMYAYGMVLVR